MDDKTIRSYGEQALRDEAQAILDQIALLDDNFEKAVDMMYHCQGKIIVTGVGKSGHVGAKIAATLASLVHRHSISTRWMYITATSV